MVTLEDLKLKAAETTDMQVTLWQNAGRGDVVILAARHKDRTELSCWPRESFLSSGIPEVVPLPVAMLTLLRKSLSDYMQLPQGSGYWLIYLDHTGEQALFPILDQKRLAKGGSA